MNSNNSQKEVLLMLHSHFFSKQWVKRNNAEADGWFSQKEQLKDACWNGLTPEILPECFDKTLDKSISLWEINDGNTFIELEFSDRIESKQKEYSVNPYIFMEVQGFN